MMNITRRKERSVEAEMKLKRYKFTHRNIQEIEPGTVMLITGESLGSASYRILKALGWQIEEISEAEFLKNGGKKN